MDKKTVLVVEDDPAIRNVITLIAQQSGYSVIQAKDGEEALQDVKRADIVLLDYLLPVKSGADFLKCIRKQGNYVPVVVMSALDKKAEVLDDLGKFDVVDFVAKPFKSADISEKLKKASALADDMSFVPKATDRLKGFIARQGVL